MGRPSREVRERAVRMVEEHREAHASEWAVLQSVAPKLGCTVLPSSSVGEESLSPNHPDTSSRF